MFQCGYTNEQKAILRPLWRQRSKRYYERKMALQRAVRIAQEIAAEDAAALAAAEQSEVKPLMVWFSRGEALLLLKQAKQEKAPNRKV